MLIEGLRLEDKHPEEIIDAEPIFVEGLGLDSIDALEIVVMLESEFGLKIKNESSARESFRSVSSLAQLVHDRTAPGVKADA
jgi:acyl carrier protein